MKIDKLTIKDCFQRYMRVGALVAIFITPYTLLFMLADYLAKRFRVKDAYVHAAHAFVALIMVFWIGQIDYELGDVFYRYFHYVRYALLIHPAKLLVATGYSILFYHYGNILTETPTDWMVQAERKEDEKNLPFGEYPFNDWSHTIITGATQNGKGVAADCICRDFLNRYPDGQLVYVSAKMAGTDPHSQLFFLWHEATRVGRGLQVVSMDQFRNATSKYTPLRYLTDAEIGSLFGALDYDSNFYRTNTILWIQDICKALRAGGNHVTFHNILKIYQFESDDPKDFTYSMYIKHLIDKGQIATDEDADDYYDYLSTRIKKHAEIAQNDAGTVEQYIKGCEAVFGGEKDRLSTSITEAFNNHDIIYFDLNGASEKEATKLIGACVFQELNHCIVAHSDRSVKKLIILDEASFYMNPELMKSFFNESKAYGYRFILMTQGPSDFGAVDPDGNLWNQLTNNCGQIGTFNLKSEKDPESMANLFGTYTAAQKTRRVDGNQDTAMQSVRMIEKYLVHPNVIRNLPPLTMVFGQKGKKPIRIKWKIEDIA